MILYTCFCVIIVGISSVRSHPETTNPTDDGCSHFDQLHGGVYTWSCKELSTCDGGLILKLHTQQELSCDSRNSNKVCCPKAVGIGHTTVRRTSYIYPVFYSGMQSDQTPQAETRTTAATTSTTPFIPSSSQTQSSGWERIGGNTKYSPRIQQRVYVDCTTLDSAHLNETFKWTCQPGPCKEHTQAYFEKNDFRCSRLDDSKICCPEFKSDNPGKNTGGDSGTTDKNHQKHTGEQPVVFNHGKIPTVIKPSTIKPNGQQTSTQGTTTEEVTQGLKNRKLSKFDRDLLAVLSKDNPSKNIVLSPASIKSLLAMLVEGSTGKTSGEILHALQLNPKNEEESLRLLRDLQSVLKSDSSSITLESQNRIYKANDVNLAKNYENTVKNVYRADIETLNFSNPEEASNAINTWVNNSTHGLIPTLVDKGDLNKDMKLFLLNYIYFKANWDIEFNPMNTFPGCFYSSKDKCERIKFMSIKRALNYTNSETYKAHIFEIPFKNPRYRIIFMLPHDGVSVNEVLKKGDRIDLFQSLNKLELNSVNLTLPRTTVELSNDMIQTLQQLGIKTPFGAHATLDKMLKSKAQLSVSSVIHKARIEINEEGAKGAAASGGGVQVLSLDFDEKIIVNRPYLFFIQDTMFSEILFEGVVALPDKVQDENKRH